MSQVDAKTLAKTLVSEPVQALIFDMDGTMIDSMPYHARSWVAFAQQHGLDIELDDLMRRTTGRNGLECMRELFQMTWTRRRHGR
jgi:beta-phosphoglucomutase-like phosphatase (HAD superfamily)